jgi:hypothetical protein
MGARNLSSNISINDDDFQWSDSALFENTAGLICDPQP